MPLDAIVALVVIAVLFTILFGVIWWARGAPAYDDGRASTFVTYVAEPDDPRRVPPGASDEPAARTDPATPDPGTGGDDPPRIR